MRLLLRDKLLLAAVLLATTVLGLGTRELWNPLEGRYAGIILEWQAAGHPLVPTYENQLYDQKPPLYFWLAGAALEVLPADASDEWRRVALRWPSAAAQLLTALLLTGFCARRFGREVGVLAGLITATSWTPALSTSFAHLDTLFVLGVVGASVALDARAATRWGRATLALAGGLAFALALYAKGPVAVAFIGLAELTSAWTQRRAPRWGRSLMVGLIGTLLFALWLLPAWQSAGDAWARCLIVGQAFERHLSPAEPDRNPWWFYGTGWFGLMAPWSVFALLGLGMRAEPRRTRALLGSAIVFGVLVLSFAASRRTRYLMPLTILIVPWVALVLDAVARGGSWLRAEALRWALGLGFGVLGLAATALMALPLWPLPERGSDGAERLARGLLEARELSVWAGLWGAALAILASIFWGYRALRGRRLPLALRLFALSLALLALGLRLEGARLADAWRGDAQLVAVLSERQATEELLVVGRAAQRESAHGWFHWKAGKDPWLGTWPRSPAQLPADPCLMVGRAEGTPEWLSQPGARWERLTERPLGRAKLFVWRIRGKSD